MPLTNDNRLIASALMEQVYRRDDADQAIQDSDIGNEIASVFNPAWGPSEPTVGRYTRPGGYYYNDATGFVGRIVEANGKIFVVFRGTDNAGGFSDIIANLWKEWIGYKLPPANFTDPKDFSYANLLLGSGSTTHTQLDDALELYALALGAAGGIKSNVVVTGQSLGGGLAALVGAVTGTQTYAFATAPFAPQLKVEAAFAAITELLPVVTRNLIQDEWPPVVDTLSPQPITRDAAFLEGGLTLRNYLKNWGQPQLFGPIARLLTVRS